LGQHGHLRGNIRPRIAARRQREVMMAMVLQEYNGGHEVVVGWTDTGTGGWGTGHASLHNALAEKKWLATLVSTELSWQKCLDHRRTMRRHKQSNSLAQGVLEHLVSYNFLNHHHVQTRLPLHLILNKIKQVHTLGHQTCKGLILSSTYTSV